MPHGAEKDDDVVVAVFGPTGTGKSTFIKCALERAGTGLAANPPLVGHKLGAHTHSVQSYACQHPDMPTKTVVFVDTPGLQVDDPTASDDGLAQIATYLENSDRKGQKLTGILYFHRISDIRMGHNPLASLGMFRKLCGADALRNVIMVTSMWGLVDEDVGVSREKELIDVFWRSMVRGGSQYARFHGTCDSAWEIIGLVPEVARTFTTPGRELPTRSPGLATMVTSSAVVLYRSVVASKHHLLSQSGPAKTFNNMLRGAANLGRRWNQEHRSLFYSITHRIEAHSAKKSLTGDEKLTTYCKKFLAFALPDNPPAIRIYVFKSILMLVTRYCTSQIRHVLLDSLSVKDDNSVEACKTADQFSKESTDSEVAIHLEIAAATLCDYHQVTVLIEKEAPDKLVLVNPSGVGVIDSLLIAISTCERQGKIISTRLLASILASPNFWVPRQNTHEDCLEKILKQTRQLFEDLSPGEEGPVASLDREAVDELFRSLMNGINGWEVSPQAGGEFELVDRPRQWSLEYQELRDVAERIRSQTTHACIQNALPVGFTRRLFGAHGTSSSIPPMSADENSADADDFTLIGESRPAHVAQTDEADSIANENHLPKHIGTSNTANTSQSNSRFGKSRWKSLGLRYLRPRGKWNKRRGRALTKKGKHTQDTNGFRVSYGDVEKDPSEEKTYS